MMEKFSDIVSQYCREVKPARTHTRARARAHTHDTHAHAQVEMVKGIFEANMVGPECTKNQPPIAGSIQ